MVEIHQAHHLDLPVCDGWVRIRRRRRSTNSRHVAERRDKEIRDNQQEHLLREYCKRKYQGWIWVRRWLRLGCGVEGRRKTLTPCVGKHGCMGGGAPRTAWIDHGLGSSPSSRSVVVVLGSAVDVLCIAEGPVGVESTGWSSAMRLGWLSSSSWSKTGQKQRGEGAQGWHSVAMVFVLSPPSALLQWWQSNIWT
eukprot:9095566-Ditylum_brightwellii.AAC.1